MFQLNHYDEYAQFPHLHHVMWNEFIGYINMCKRKRY